MNPRLQRKRRVPMLGEGVYYRFHSQVYTALVVHVHLNSEGGVSDKVNLTYWDEMGSHNTKLDVSYAELKDNKDNSWFYPPRNL